MLLHRQASCQPSHSLRPPDMADESKVASGSKNTKPQVEGLSYDIKNPHYEERTEGKSHSPEPRSIDTSRRRECMMGDSNYSIPNKEHPYSPPSNWLTLGKEHFDPQAASAVDIGVHSALQRNFWYHNQATLQLSNPPVQCLPANLIRRSYMPNAVLPTTPTVYADIAAIQMPLPVQSVKPMSTSLIPTQRKHVKTETASRLGHTVTDNRNEGDGKVVKPRVHRWSHSDIMQLIWCWCEASLEPKVDLQGGRGQKWKLIYQRFSPNHPWSSETSIRAYFKTKIKDKYNCRVVYDYISRHSTLPLENDPLIYQR